MKKRKVLIIFLILICLTGCKNKPEESANIISEKVVEYMHNNNVKTKGMNKEEKKIFNEFIESQKEDNQIINLEENNLIIYDAYTENENSDIIYKEDDNYFVKYSDLVFAPLQDDYCAYLALDHHPINICKSQFPILYDETNVMGKYNYIYDFTNTYEDKIEVYYKSLSDATGITFRYYIADNNINDIYLIYNNVYHPEKIDNNQKRGSAILVILVSVVVFILLVLLIIWLLAHTREKY